MQITMNFAKEDDCLDKMVPSDLRLLVSQRDRALELAENQNSTINSLIADRDALAAKVEQIKGVKPAIPPRPPYGNGLPRFGIKWNGDREPITTPMDDGYWTPYHLAIAHDAEVAKAAFIAGVEARRIALLNDEQAAIKSEQYAAQLRAKTNT